MFYGLCFWSENLYFVKEKDGCKFFTKIVKANFWATKHSRMQLVKTLNMQNETIMDLNQYPAKRHIKI